MLVHLDGEPVWPPHIERLMRRANDLNARRRTEDVMGQFREHLKTCTQCERHPFDPCQVGIACKNADRAERGSPGMRGVSESTHERGDLHRKFLHPNEVGEDFRKQG
jgi:hypothetical protein